MKFIVLLLFFPIFCFSQYDYSTGNVSDHNNSKVNFSNPIKLRDHIYAGVPDIYKKDIYTNMSFLFASQTAKSISKKLKEVSIYDDNQELNVYLNDILSKVIPDELKKDSVLRVLVVKDGTFNAGMVPSGHIFFNIGCFQQANDEAFIASIFLHELAHYYLKHSLKEYIAWRTGKFDRGLGGISNKLPDQFSVKQEKQADSLALVWMEKSPYDIQGLLNSFKALERIERNELSRREDLMKLKEITHPLSEDRYNAIVDFCQKHEISNGTLFIVSKDKFLHFKETLKPIILQSLLDDYQYYTCIESAFKYHLADPDNNLYIDYILEGIRRECYVNANIWKENFIANRYYDTVKIEDHYNKRKMTDHLFKRFNYDIFCMSNEDLSNIRAIFYWKGQPKFRTYEEAFEFYYRGGKALSSKECILSNALSYSNDKKTRDELLKEYLAQENIKNRDFAERILSDTIYQHLPNRKLIIFENLESSVSQGKNDFPIFNTDDDSKDNISIIVDSILKVFKNDTSIYLPATMKKDPMEYSLMMDLRLLTFQTFITKGVKPEFCILDPRFWSLFDKYNVNEIIFVKCNYTEERPDKKDLTAYKQMMEEGNNIVLKRGNSTRYIDFLITSARMVKNKSMTTKYYSGSNKIDFKDSGYNQVIKEMISQLNIRAKKINEQDQYFNNLNK